MFGAGSRLYLLDEPFGWGYSVSEEIISEYAERFEKAGKTVLIVHHDLSKVSHYFDQVLLVNREVIAFGPTKETFTEANLKEAYGNRLFFNGGDL